MKLGNQLSFRKIGFIVFLCCAFSGGVMAEDLNRCGPKNAQTREIVDMANRTVVLPNRVDRVATVGSVPVLNGYLLALGAGEQIVNGLPARFTTTNRWQLHNSIAPYLVERPVIQGQVGGAVSIEKLIRLAPDVVVTMDMHSLKALEKAQVPVVYLEWADMSDIYTNLSILSCMLDRPTQRTAYLRYLDHTMGKVHRALENVPQQQRPRVLYFNPQTMMTPLLIANWWIEQAGGHSVTADMDRGGSAHYSHERLLAWNPDHLIVSSPEQVEAIYQDKRFANIAAVKNRQVHITPMGAHFWGNRTIEQPLTVLWAASLLHPEIFAQTDMEAEVRTFYQQFYNYDLSSKELRAMFDGRAESLGE